MSATTGERTAIERYLDAVRTELADLPDDERVEMLEDVEQHLLEVAAEGDEPLETRLGPPAEYAAELRTAAGLPKRVSPSDPFAQRLAARISGSGVVRSVATLHAGWSKSRIGTETSRFVRSLQPAWWLARACIAALALGVLTSRGEAFRSFHNLGIFRLLGLVFPPVFGSQLVGFAVLLLLIAASVAWSRAARRLRWLTALTVIGNIAALLIAVNLVNTTGRFDRRFYGFNGSPQPATPSYNPAIVRGPQGSILNIYPYAADGTPLKNVLLYDQNGNPIPGVVMDTYARDRGARDENGQLIPNMFPYPEAVIDARTGEIVGPRQAPRITAPQVMPTATPSGPPMSPALVSPPSNGLSPTASFVESPSPPPAPSPSPSTSASTSPSASAPASPSARIGPSPTAK